MKFWMDWANTITALGAAGFWGWSALIRVPDLMETKVSGKGSITDIIRRQSKLSAIAAGLAATSVIAQIISKFSN